jgi:hypothetical protein
MYPHAASAASSMAWLARLANPNPLAPRQSPSQAFNSGVAVGNQRVSIPNAVASARLALAVWGEPRSTKSTMCQPRQAWRTWRKKAWWVAAVQSSVISSSTWPLVTLSAPWMTRRACLPVMGTSAWTPTLAQPARKGGVSRTNVSSSISTTVRCRPLRPRLSPLWPGASTVNAAPRHSGGASSGSRGDAGSGARSPHSPHMLAALASNGTATASSTALRGSRVCEAPSPAPSPTPVRPTRPVAAGGRRELRVWKSRVPHGLMSENLRKRT